MIHSTLKIKVFSLYIKIIHPIHFFRHLSMLLINLSQDPHQGSWFNNEPLANSVVFQITNDIWGLTYLNSFLGRGFSIIRN